MPEPFKFEGDGMPTATQRGRHSTLRDQKRVTLWCGTETNRDIHKGNDQTMIQEFKDFINKGGVFEAAVGLILALAFAPIVNSMVADVIMPIVGRIFGAPDFSELKIGLGGSEEVTLEDGTVVMQEAAIRYGAFINTIISFAMIAFVIFMLVKAYNKRNGEPEEDGPSAEDLLTEIRDSLAK